MVVIAESHHQMQYKIILSLSKVLFCLRQVIRLLKHLKLATAEGKLAGWRC